MKRNNNYLILVAALLVLVAAIALWGCEKSDSAYANYTPADFIGLDNFTMKTNVKKDSVMRYSEEGGALYYSSTHIGDGYTNTVYYVFAGGDNREYSEGEWKEIEDSDVEKYKNSIESACGLIYNKLDATQFEEIKGKKLIFRVAPEQFFKQAYRQIYQNYFGTDYDEDSFNADFEQNAPSLFGDMTDYEIRLDCSSKGKMVLEISNGENRQSDVYEYYAIGKTKIDLPE